MIKIPLGVTRDPFEWHGIVTSQELPGWIADSLPPAAISDPKGFLRDAQRVVDAVREYSTWF